MKHCLPKKPRISRLSISPTLEQLHYITHLVVYNLLDVVSAPLHVQKELDHLQKNGTKFQSGIHGSKYCCT